MKTGRTFKIVFTACFFLLYALFPLTRGLSTESITSDPSRGTSGRTFRNTSLYLSEAFYVAFSKPKVQEKEPSRNPLLITKKSTVLRSKFDLLPQSDSIVVFTPADPVARQHFKIEDERAKILRSWLRKSYACLRLSSGVSPPLLS